VPPVTQLQLSQKTIFILPTLQGVIVGFGASIVMVIAIAERNPVALMLSALMLGVFLLGLILCYRNLSGLRLAAHDADDPLPRRRCFVGDTARYTVSLSAPARSRSYQNLWLGFTANTLQPVSLAPGGDVEVNLNVTADRRGLLTAPRLIVRTRYPAGLWQAWSRPDLLMRCLVYPRPQACLLPPLISTAPAGDHGRQRLVNQAGMDDFIGLRDYQPGDSIRRVAWQALARGQGLKTKQFVRDAEPQILLTFEDFPGRDAETILACLCFQVLKFNRSGQAIGLRLPGEGVIRPGYGEAHKHRLLQALALWT
tara:strand:+ start:1195 stop:2127 length:933 start_codon:yes stop_codon:yes gene_type:complete